MTPAVAKPKPRARRMSADERRGEVLEAALVEFAAGGLHGTSTEVIAARAGVSQPYLFRLFGTKKELFLACYRLCCEQVLAAFQAAAEKAAPDATPEERLLEMGKAYKGLLANHDLPRMQMQGYVAAADPEIRAAARKRYAELFGFVEQASGAPSEQVVAFFATGMLLNVSASLGLSGIEISDPEAWAVALKRGR